MHKRVDGALKRRSRRLHPSPRKAVLASASCCIKNLEYSFFEAYYCNHWTGARAKMSNSLACYWTNNPKVCRPVTLVNNRTGMHCEECKSGAMRFKHDVYSMIHTFIRTDAQRSIKKHNKA